MDESYDIAAMRNRLKAKLDEAGLSMRAASINAGLGAGWVQATLQEDGPEPSIVKLAQMCAKNGISLPYVLFGFEMSSETRQILEMMESDPQKRDGLLALMASQNR